MTPYLENLLKVVSPASKFNISQIAYTLSSLHGAPLDNLYTRLGGLNGLFFPGGWGDLKIVNYEEDIRTLLQWPPTEVNINWKLLEQSKRNGINYSLYEGTFRTPCVPRIYDALPPESRTARVQLLVPGRMGALGAPTAGSFLRQAADETSPDPPACVLHLAATGDQGFGRRLRLGHPLLQENIATMVLESPYYGARRPPQQRGAKLLRVSDLFILGYATIHESLCLLHWLEQNGFGSLGICGLSMGGVHACMTAGLYPADVACIPLLAPRSAAVAYCDGALRTAMAWEPLLQDVDEKQQDVTQVVLHAGQAVSVLREATYALAELELNAESIGEGKQRPRGSVMDMYENLAGEAQKIYDRRQAAEEVSSAAAGQPVRGASSTSCASSTAATTAAKTTAAAAAVRAPLVCRDDSSPTAVHGSPSQSLDLRDHSTAAQRDARPDDISSPSSSSRARSSRDLDSPLHGHDQQKPAPHRHHTLPHPHHHAAAGAAAAEGEDDEAGISSLGRRLSRLVAAAQQLRSSDRSPAAQETVRKLKKVLETYTDITRYPRPRRPDAAVFVAAQDDGYVSLESVKQIHKYWEHSELRLVTGGHVSAFVMQHNMFRQAIRDSLALLRQGPSPALRQRQQAAARVEEVLEK